MRQKPQKLALRNTLNILFMILAVVGGYFFAYKDQLIGGIIIMVAIFIKLVECIIRFIYRNPAE